MRPCLLQHSDEPSWVIPPLWTSYIWLFFGSIHAMWSICLIFNFATQLSQRLGVRYIYVKTYSPSSSVSLPSFLWPPSHSHQTLPFSGLLVLWHYHGCYPWRPCLQPLLMHACHFKYHNPHNVALPHFQHILLHDEEPFALTSFQIFPSWTIFVPLSIFSSSLVQEFNAVFLMIHHFFVL